MQLQQAFFDPWGISARVPEGQLLFYREAELKHGRVCMLAFLGLIIADSHLFIPVVGEGIPKDKEALGMLLATPYIQETRASQLWPSILGAIGLFDALWSQSPGRTENAPGDYGFDPLGFRPKDPKELNLLQTKELNNGRLAMIAVAGIIAQEGVTNHNVLR